MDPRIFLYFSEKMITIFPYFEIVIIFSPYKHDITKVAFNTDLHNAFYISKLNIFKAIGSQSFKSLTRF